MISSRGISSLSRVLVRDIKFAETGDEDILSGFKGLFGNIKNHLGYLGRFGFGESAVFIDVVYDVRFGQCHDGSPKELKI